MEKNEILRFSRGRSYLVDLRFVFPRVTDTHGRTEEMPHCRTLGRPPVIRSRVRIGCKRQIDPHP